MIVADKVCMVIGAAGQDGSILTNILKDNFTSVVAICRSKPKSDRYVHSDRVLYDMGDIGSTGFMASVLQKYKPDLIFHLAAVHGPAGTEYELRWRPLVDVNIHSVHDCLEYLRNLNPDGWLFYASSARVFGKLDEEISEDSPKNGADLYAISKITSGRLIENYRKNHNLKACVGYLFQHDSRFRSPGYFVPKIIEILQESLKNREFYAEVYTLDFRVDSGCAHEFMEIAMALGKQKASGDFIIATGKTVYMRDEINRLFAHFDLDYRRHIVENATTEKRKIDDFICDTSRLEGVLRGRRPIKTFFDVCIDIIGPIY